jgi:hypothetical protein
MLLAELFAAVLISFPLHAAAILVRDPLVAAMESRFSALAIVAVSIEAAMGAVVRLAKVQTLVGVPLLLVCSTVIVATMV